MKFMASLPLPIKKKVRALRKLQLITTHLDAEFHRKVYELERSFEERHRDIFKKRFEIINGDYEPTEEECNYSDAEYTLDYTHAIDDFPLSVDNSCPPFDANARGVPDFWLTIFKYVPLFETFVKETDEPALKHLVDIRCVTKPPPDLSFTLEFHFSPNPFFSNSVLTKEYLLKCDPDNDDPFSFDGPEIYKCIGCNIDWYEGKDLTCKTVKRKSQLNQDRGSVKIIKTESFFNFFDPPEIPEDEHDPQFDDINTILETDFEIGHYLKERIVPRAVLYFTGESDDFSDSTSNDDESEDCDVSEEDIGEEGGNVPDGDGDAAP
ncbi:unnamed protein product [Hermetia illucens]|uniref:Uncharacterized protein n=1 Tax=Hermetia illucens TaxID=343691 RepID=A0A7R8V5A9_HERIL|nr:unnamed protein product [Hermetia illucens]